MVNLGFNTRQEEHVIAAKCENLKELAISEKIKVGCIIEGWRYNGINHGEEFQYFGGSNIEISKSYAYHAEMIALTDCIMHRFQPIRIFVTSQLFEEKTFLCGNCRQQLLEINKKCEVIIFNPDGSRKTYDKLTISTLLPFHKKVDEKNGKFYRILGTPNRL